MNRLRRSRLAQSWRPHPATDAYYRRFEEIWVDASGHTTRLTGQTDAQGETVVEQVAFVRANPTLTCVYTTSSQAQRSPFNPLLGANWLGWTAADAWHWEAGLAMTALTTSLLSNDGRMLVERPAPANFRDDAVMDAEIVSVKPKQQRLQPFAAGLRNWWQQTARQARHWANRMGDRLQRAIGSR